MNSEIKSDLYSLISISHFYGRNKEYVIAGGGNTSCKDHELIYVKSSGNQLSTIQEDGFVCLGRERLKQISVKQYSDEVLLREQEVLVDLNNSRTNPEKNQRPSVETSIHNLFEYKFVIHTHPTVVNALLCSEKAEEMTHELFGDKAMYVKYCDPGYTLFKKLEAEVEKYRKKMNVDPHIIFLQNHGVFVCANTTQEIKELYEQIHTTISSHFKEQLVVNPLSVNTKTTKVLPAVRMILSQDHNKIARLRYNSLVSSFCSDELNFSKVNNPFTPDDIVYCKAHPLYITSTGTPEQIVEEFLVELEKFREKNGYDPKIILFKELGMVGVEDNSKSVETILDVFENIMKISFYAQNFGGPHFMKPKDIAFIDTWEVENYRRKVSKQNANSKADNKIIIVTGGAQGFGGGIVEMMHNDGANVVIADLNEKSGKEFCDKLNLKSKNNKAIFVKADVSNPESVKGLIAQTVSEFGGLDVFVSNAGVLRAGGLDELEPDVFEFMTKVNYTGYYLCAKYSAEVLKIQSKFKKNYFTDIIQINSKSGLKGSNKNFAYAGGKFGGIGLTQSFAMELMPFRIKVNSICPGNFFEGPLWSDPEKGLFVQYLRAGKVPGAKTIDDVKKFYEAQVPAGRGCRVEDVMKAIYYVMEQEYETGQAIPVTGGQNMLN